MGTGAYNLRYEVWPQIEDRVKLPNYFEFRYIVKIKAKKLHSRFIGRSRIDTLCYKVRKRTRPARDVVLDLTKNHGGPITPDEVARRMRTTKAFVTTVVEGLIKERQVKRLGGGPFRYIGK